MADVAFGAYVAARTAKASLVDADLFVISDSAAAGVGKKVTLTTLLAALVANDRQTAADATRTQVASTTLATKLELAFTPPVAGTYRIDYSCEFGVDNTAATDVKVRVDLDATSTSSTDGTTLQGDNTTGIVLLDTYQVSDGYVVTGFYEVSLTAALHTVRIKFARTGASNNAEAQNARISARRIL